VYGSLYTQAWEEVAPVTDDCGEHSMNASTVELNFKRSGSGRPVLILHGLFGSSSNWGKISRELSTEHQVFALDLRNHGESPHHNSMTYAEMAEDVAEFVRRHEIEYPTIVGHSMGGKVAMILALTQPQLISALLVIDIAPVFYTHDYLPLIRAMADLDLEGIGSRGDADKRLKAEIPDDALRGFLLQNLVLENGGYRWRFNLAALANGLPDILGFEVGVGASPYAGDVRFLGGENSDYLNPNRAVEVLEWFPNAVIEMVSGCGHWLHAERPDSVIDAIRSL
jgi:pimeloyl-ACP methyl ester carboxylesterase